MGLILSFPTDRLVPFGLEAAARRAAAKIWEAFPDQTRTVMAESRDRFCYEHAATEDDPRLPALAKAVRDGVVVRLRMRRPPPQEVHPIALRFDGREWLLDDALSGSTVSQDLWGDINISRRAFV